MDKSEILQQLKINREEPQPPARWPWILLGLALLGAGTWWILGGHGAKPLLVKTALVLAQAPANASILDATGYVVARRQATVSAKITGKIAEVYIEEGQKVAEGQVLARLDPTDANAQVELAKSQLDAARAQLNDFQILLAQAQREVTRQDELVTRKLASAQAGEQARSAADSLTARLASQRVQIVVAEMSLQVATVNKENTIVKAPFAGVVVAKNAQPGEVVSPLSAGGFTRTGIGTLVDMDSLEIEVDVNESFIGRVQAGQPVEARLNAYPDWVIPAEVIAIIPTADRSKATVKVRIALKLKDPRIVPEMGVRVAFLNDKPTVSAAPVGVQVPVSAIARQEGESAVYVLADGVVHRRAVKLGQTAGDSQQILEGLKGGERVVLEPPPGLRDGEKLIAE